MKDLKEKAQKRELEDARKALKKRKDALQSELKRSARSKRVAKQRIGKNHAKVDKFAVGFFGNRAEKTAGKNKIRYEKDVEEAKSKHESLREEKRKVAYINVQSKKSRGLLLAMDRCTLKLPKGRILISDINLKIFGDSRIAIHGKNGTGKTALVKQLQFEMSDSIYGKVRYGREFKTVYIDQKYNLIDPQLTIHENIKDRSSIESDEKIRQALGNLEFPHEYELHKKTGVLSGGEVVRLTFAIASLADPDLLILDEPTNNLDIETVESVVSALNSYEGALVVVSHNLDFLERLNIQRSYTIRDGKMCRD